MMDADRAIAIIETILAPKALSLVQIQIVRGVIAGRTYQEIAAANDLNEFVSGGGAVDSAAQAGTCLPRYQLSYLRETSAQLWQSLSHRLGQKVTKKSLAAVLYWYVKQLETETADLEAGAQLPSAELHRSTSCLVSMSWAGFAAVAPDIDKDNSFHGRTEELATLTDLCLHQRCRTISAIGMGGMGKSTLVWKFARQVEQNFEAIVWRSLLTAPTVAELCTDLCQLFGSQSLADLPETLEAQIDLTIACLQQTRCLLILDNVESILAGQSQTGQYLTCYEDYDRLFKAIGERSHQSCLMLTSREKPHTIARLEVVNPQLIRSISIGGLTSESGHQLIQSLGCPVLPAAMWTEVYEHYGGNPLALKFATITAIEMTGGGEKVLDLYPLMRQGKLPFRNIDDILQRQFERLSTVEQQLVYWLAIEREPITSIELQANLVPNPAILGEIFNAQQSILRRCIAIRQGQLWALQPVTIAYVTQRSIAATIAELSLNPTQIEREDLLVRYHHLNTYAIIKATAKDYLRQTQIQSILRPIVDRLLVIWGDKLALYQHLRQILQQWQTFSIPPPGYLAGNILNLMLELTGRSLQDLDCSRLPIWSAYLVDVKLRRVNFAAAVFDRSIFTQAFGGIVSTTFDPAGNLLATGDANGDIHLWQIADGQRVAIYQGHSNWTRALAFTPDGRILASASDDCTIKLWDVQTGGEITTIGPHTHSFRGVLFSSDSQKLVTGGDDCSIRIYDLLSLLTDAVRPSVETHCIQKLIGHTNWVFSATYSPDLSQLASASADGTVRIWDVATGMCLHVLTHGCWMIRTIFSPDGRRLIASGMSSQLYIWDTVTGKLIQTLDGHTDWIWSIECSSDGNTLFSTGEDLTIRSWDLTTGACQQVFRAHKQRVWTLALSPDGKQLVSGSEDRTIKIWDLDLVKCVKKINGYGNRIESIAVLPDRNCLASGHYDRTIRIWDLQDLTCIQTLTGHTDAIISIAVSPDGCYLASSSLDLTTRIWHLRDLSCLHIIDTDFEGGWSLAFSPDGRQLIAGGHNAELSIWDVATGRLDRPPIVHPGRIQSIAVCKIHKTIATACENAIRIWDLHTGECLQTLDAHLLPVIPVTFSPDGRYLASGSMDKTVKLWDTTTWQCLQTLTGHQSWAISLAFSPVRVTHLDRTDYQLVSGSCDRLVKRWDLATGQCIQTYVGHTNWVLSIGYSQDGTKIFSASEDETIQIWEIDRCEPLQTLRLKRPYEDTNITGATGLLPGQRKTLKLLGAIDA